MIELENLVSELEKYSDLSKSKADLELGKLRSKAEKRINDTTKRLDIILDTVIRFKEDVEIVDASAMDKYSNKIYEEVTSTVKSINRPTKITLRTLEKYSEETRSSLLKQDQTLIKYTKLLKGAKYGKRVKSLSKALVKYNSDLTKLERFITSEYTPSAGIENIALIIDDVFDYFKRLDVVHNLILEKEEDIIAKDLEIEDIKVALNQIQNHPVKVELKNAKEALSALHRETESRFQNIRKAFRKYENNLSKMKNKPDTTLLKELLKDITITLANQGSLGGVSALLQAVAGELGNASLKLKRDRREATKADIDALLGGELNEIWNNSKANYQNWQVLENKLKEMELDIEETKISTNLEAAKRDRNRIIEREMRDFEKTKESTIKTIEDIAEKIKSTIDPEANLVSELVNLPAWTILLE
ncbi:MAG: hypothetical protein GPJ54_13185 [Candidatus Heimdallarchaeota archaeon]|nr:hypothetical protein [Candidatus Heimdallarchaeota archaeon]